MDISDINLVLLKNIDRDLYLEVLNILEIVSDSFAVIQPLRNCWEDVEYNDFDIVKQLMHFHIKSDRVSKYEGRKKHIIHTQRRKKLPDNRHLFYCCNESIAILKSYHSFTQIREKEGEVDFSFFKDGCVIFTTIIHENMYLGDQKLFNNLLYKKDSK